MQAERMKQDMEKMMAQLSASQLSDEDSIAGACDTELNDSEPFGDGDQRENLVSCGHGEPLYQMWCRGGNLNPWKRPHQYSDFFVACACGQVHAVEAAISKVSDTDLHALLERRESSLRYSPLHVTAAGSRLEVGTPSWPFNPSRPPAHVGVVRALLTAGARINAKDIMGNAPIGLAAGPFATARSLEVARAIAKHGPDLHTKTRFGQPLLFQPCSCKSPNVEAISLLLELGADPTASMGSFATHGGLPPNSLFAVLQQQGHRQALALLEPLSSHCLPISTAVEIHGLAARPDLNGARAVIRGWHSKENRYAVELTSLADAGATVGAAGLASRVRVKPANLQKVVEERDAAAAKQGSKDAKGKHYGPLNIKPGRVVRMHGLQSRADLNDRHAVVEKWDHAAGRYHLWVRPAVGHRAEVVRVKPENASKDICDDTVDPDELPPWRGHGAIRGHHGPLATCFESAMPVGALMGLSSGRSEADLTPRVQFLYSLFHIANAWESHTAPRSWRHVLEHAESGTSVTVDVLRAPLECPEHMEVATTRFKQGATDGAGSDASKASPAAAEPLLLVRYLVGTREPSRPSTQLPVARLDDTFPDRCRIAAACSLAADASGGAHINLVQAASAAQVSQAVAMLQESAEELDEAFMERFYAQSEHHRQEDGFFHCSFLVPPTERMLQETVPPPVCILCGRSAPEGEKLKRCARCTAEYCSKECQTSHWNEHKKVCKKSAEQLRARGSGSGGGGDGPTRASLVFDLAYVPPAMRGMSHANLSVSGQATRPRVLEQGKAPKSVHGTTEFSVKVQATDAALLGSEGAMPCSVYDEARSFNGFLECYTPGIDPLLRLIQDQGALIPGRGGKGYFLARREGTSLRIFTDRILPQPAW